MSRFGKWIKDSAGYVGSSGLLRGRLHGPTIMARFDGEWVANPERGVWEEYRKRVLEEDTDRWKHLEDDRGTAAREPTP